MEIPHQPDLEIMAGALAQIRVPRGPVRPRTSFRDRLAVAMWGHGKEGSWDHDNPPWSGPERHLYKAAADAAILFLGDAYDDRPQATEREFWDAYEERADKLRTNHNDKDN